MSEIRPGALCFLVGEPIDPDWLGRVVSVVKFVPVARLWMKGDVVQGEGMWEISAPWLPPPEELGRGATAYAVFRRNLRPIHDPDQSVETPAETVQPSHVSEEE